MITEKCLDNRYDINTSSLGESLSYDPLKDQFFLESLTLCDRIFYPLRDRIITRLWRRKMRIYNVDFQRGMIIFDYPVTSLYNRMRYSRIILIPRGFIRDSRHLQILWTAAYSVEKPADGDLDSVTVAVFTLKSCDTLPFYYRFEKIAGRSKAEFMVFTGLPAKCMFKLLEILIQFFEKKLRGFLRAFNIPHSALAYSTNSFFIKAKRPRIILQSFWKWRPNVVDYIKTVKSWWLRSALKGLMQLINELTDAYHAIITPLMKTQLEVQQAVRRAARRIDNIRLVASQLRRLIEITLLQELKFYQQSSPKHESVPPREPNAPGQGI